MHHWVFRGTEDAAVCWTPGSTGHAMRHCLFHGMYGTTRSGTDGLWLRRVHSPHRSAAAEFCVDDDVGWGHPRESAA
jgi:hypothetical protein